MLYNEHILTQHWLYQWIDEEGIKTPGNYMKAIRRRRSFERLRELSDAMEQVSNLPKSTDDTVPNSIIAARQLDLSGFLSCPCFECQVPAIDNVFSRAWHYFDSVVIAEEPLTIGSVTDDRIYDLLQKVQLFLYLRKIGADRHILFTNKVWQLCDDHFREHAEERNLRLDAIFDTSLEEEVVRRLTSEGRVVIFEEGNSWGYEIKHPDIGQLTGTVPHSEMSRRPSREYVARMAFGKCCTALISDVSAAQSLGIPLLQAAEHTWIPRAPDSDDSKVDDRGVALNIRLPFLRQVPVKEVLKYREDNWASFEVFRSALRQAIRAQIEQAGSKSPRAIANAVVEEYIQPEIAKIELELATTKKTLSRKINAHIAIGGAAVSVGAVANMPLLIAATATAAAASIAQIINKNADSRQPIEAAPMYFLWKMQKRRRH
jgi:hypothetical protein